MHIHHINIAHEVLEDVDAFLFNLTILGYLKHSDGLVWRRTPNDLYLIECMPPMVQIDPSTHSCLSSATQSSLSSFEGVSFHYVLNYLPSIYFREPKVYLYDLENDGEANQGHKFDNNFALLYDKHPFQSTSYYLRKLKELTSELTTFKYYSNNSNEARSSQQPKLSQIDCLKVLLEHSGLKNPTWAELHNFVTFLNEQLYDTEKSPFLADDELVVIRELIIKCLILMAYDFALPSLNIGEETPKTNRTQQQQQQDELMNVDEAEGDAGGNNAGGLENVRNTIEGADMSKLEITRRWERLSHPYILFNADRSTFTFMGLLFGPKK